MFDDKKNLFGTQTTTPTFSSVISASTLAPIPSLKLPTTPVAPSSISISSPSITPQIQQNPQPQPQAGQVVNNRYTDPQGNLRDAKTGAILDKTTGQPTATFQQTPADITPPVTPKPTQTQDIATPTQEETDQRSIMDRILGFFGRQKTSEQIRQEAESRAGIAQQQQVTDDLFNEISQIEAQNRNDVLSLQGQGRGIDQTILSRQANEINRQYAIRLEPKRALYQAVAGRLDRANQAVERAVNAELETQKQRLDYFRLAYEMNKDSLERVDKKRLEEAQARLKKEERDYEEAKFNRTESLKIANAAVIGAQSMGVKIPDDVMSRIQNATTPEEALGFATPYLGSKERMEIQKTEFEMQKIKADITKTNAEIAEKLGTGTTSTKENAMLSNLQLTNDILANAGTISGVFQPGLIPFTSGSKTSAQYEQLKGILALSNREQLKGSGAISDFEFRVLQSSASALSRLTKQSDFITELRKVRGVFATSAGLMANVKITDPSNGNFVIVNADRNVINQAIKDGASVEYQ